MGITDRPKRIATIRRKESRWCVIVVVLFLSIFAYIFDLGDGKVPNALIIIGYTSGFIYAISKKGASGIPEAIISLVWPILLLYILFRIRALGAGDIKMFSVISLFLDHHQMLMIIYLSFITGAVFGAVRLIRNRQILAHLKNFQDYVFNTLTEKRITYYKTINNELGSLHFCGCIFAACIMLFCWEELINNGIF